MPNDDESARPGLAHTLWRTLPRGPRRAALARLTASLAPRPGPPPPSRPPGAAIIGEIGRASGLGEGARLMAAALAQLGLPAPTLTLTPGGHPAPPPPGMPLIFHVNAPHIAAALLRLPRAWVRGRAVIGYWAWELPTLPPSWRLGVPFVHQVWVPSRFTQEALAPLLPGRVHRVPHPLAAVPPRPAPLCREDFGWPDGAVVVLAIINLASSFVRKNPLGAIAAFRAAFANRADRLLVLKLSGIADFPADFAKLREAVAGCPNIRIDTRLLPGADLHAMTSAADIVLSLHRSEGFGLVPAQAMLLGRAVVATGWSGNMDFMDSNSAALIGYTLVPARDPRGVFEAPGAVWAEPDIADAAAALRHLANDPPARHALGQAARLSAARALGAEALARALANLPGQIVTGGGS